MSISRRCNQFSVQSSVQPINQCNDTGAPADSSNIKLISAKKSTEAIETSVRKSETSTVHPKKHKRSRLSCLRISLCRSTSSNNVVSQASSNASLLDDNVNTNSRIAYILNQRSLSDSSESNSFSYDLAQSIESTQSAVESVQPAQKSTQAAVESVQPAQKSTQPTQSAVESVQPAQKSTQPTQSAVESVQPAQKSIQPTQSAVESVQDLYDSLEELMAEENKLQEKLGEFNEKYKVFEDQIKKPNKSRQEKTALAKERDLLFTEKRGLIVSMRKTREEIRICNKKIKQRNIDSTK